MSLLRLASALLLSTVLAATTARAACPVVWLLGDSQTVLYGDGNAGAAGLIAQHPEWCVTNLARGGETSASGLTRIGQFLADDPLARADVAVVLYGENDRVHAFLETIGNDPACQAAMLSCPLPTASTWHQDSAGERILELVALLRPRVGEVLIGLPVEGVKVPHTPALESTWQLNRWLRSWALGLRRNLIAAGHRTVNFRLTKPAEFVPGDPFHQSAAGIAKHVRKAGSRIASSLRRQGIQ